LAYYAPLEMSISLGSKRRMHVVWLLLAGVISFCFFRSFPTPKAGSDFECHWRSARLLHDGQSPYCVDCCYVYHPVLATVLSPFAVDSRGWILEHWTLIGAAFAIMTAAMNVLALGLWGTLLGLLAFAALFSQSVTFGVEVGNITVVAAMCLAIALAVNDRSSWVSGVFFGLASVLKVIPGVFVLFLLVHGFRHKRRADLVAAAAAIIVIGVASLNPHMKEWWAKSAGYVAELSAVNSNFSWIDSIFRLSRIMLSPWLFYGASAAISVQLGLSRRVRRKNAWAILALACVLFSPVAWSHWFAFAIFPILYLINLTIHFGLGCPPNSKIRTALWGSTLLFIATAIWGPEYYCEPSWWLSSHLTPLLPMVALSLALGALYRIPERIAEAAERD
jgi:hypothetical protein